MRLSRKAFADIFIIILIIGIGVAIYAYHYLSKSWLSSQIEKEKRIKQWERVIYDYFDKYYPNLKCYCAIRKGKKTEKVDFLEVASNVMGVCENSIEKYPEDGFAIRAACTKWIIAHFDGLHRLKEYPELLSEGQKNRELELRELQDRFSRIESLLKRYGLVAALTLVFLVLVLVALMFGLHKKISHYLELKENAEREFAEARREAETVLKRAEKEKESIVSEANLKAQAILGEAQKEASNIIDEARERAEEIVEQARKYAEAIKEQAFQEVEEEMRALKEQNEEMKKELAKLRSNLSNPVYLASYLTESDEMLSKFVRALVNQKEAERVQRELRKALRKKS
jgi:cell division septum initiation protein DivIVA